MTPESINVAIAKELGWIDFKTDLLPVPRTFSDTYRRITGKNPNGAKDTLPNFHGSRDACAQFESTLAGRDRHGYYVILASMFWPLGWSSWEDTAKVASATAPQRCEAFLRTKGKWVEEKGEK